MALSGSIINADGTPTTYFIISRICISPGSELVDVEVQGYYNEATYMSPCISNFSLNAQFTFVQLGVTDDVTTAQVYAGLQTLPQFAGSVVV